ncbi:hypothetical protein H6781_02235 [Candidatus Nomurabacteria bacterium]|nr:hypothetical protein [Candidatus Nomurabacteria bacterium]MCB9818026.1 hypothetical protein [Candidatus Nomurabacteria bacterium]
MNSKMSTVGLMEQKGFAFLPIVIIVAALMVGAGAGVVATKQLSSNKTEEPEPVLVSESTETEFLEAQTPTTTEEIAETSTANKNISPAMEEVPQVVNVPKPTNEPAQVSIPEVSMEADTQAPTPVLTNTTVDEDIINAKAEEAAIAAETVRVQQLTYDQVKTESATLTEGMDMVIEQYEKKKDIVEQNLELCTSKYENGVAQAEADAEYLKTTYAESRSGFASSPSTYTDIDAALELDLNQLEIEFEYCKTTYQLDTSIESDIKQIDRKQNNIMVKLSLENAADSLDTIRELQQNLLGVANRVW